VVTPNDARGIPRPAFTAGPFFRVSVDQVEGMTGYDFFSNVPASIQNVIEARVDNL
jgi:endonuclease G